MTEVFFPHLLNDEDCFKNRFDHERIFKIIKKPRETMLAEVSALSLRERDYKAELLSSKWAPLISGPIDSPRILVLDGRYSGPGGDISLHMLEKESSLVWEGFFIACYALGIQTAYVYVPSSETKIIKKVEEELCEIRQMPFFQKLEKDQNFSCHLHYGLPDYFGFADENLFAEMNGVERGQHALFNGIGCILQPETAGMISAALKLGAENFTQIGTNESKGTKVISVVGHVNKPFYKEVVLGTPMKDLFVGGLHGVRGGWSHLSGLFPYSAFSKSISKTELDQLTLCFESFKRIGAHLGKGEIILVNQSVSMTSAKLALFKFFMSMSADKCFTCRRGIPWLIKEMESHSYGQRKTDGAMKRILKDVLVACACDYRSQYESLLKDLAQSFGDIETVSALEEEVLSDG